MIVIPSRYGSTRFPGKPLAPIAGRSLLERVLATAVTAAKLVGDVAVLVATDDDRIAAHAEALGARVAMVRERADNGSERVLHAVRREAEVPGIVVNLQGDALFTPPETVAALFAAARATGAPVTTPVVQLDWGTLDRLRAAKQTSPFSGTSCIRAADGRALWFSKALLPAIRDEAAHRARSPLSPVWQHIGLYAYRIETLERFVALPPGHYEALEGLEQLRLIEAGIPILTVEAAPSIFPLSGIDTPEDAARAEALIARLGDPMDA